MLFKVILKRSFLFLLLIFTSLALYAQSGEFEEVEVSHFQAPYSEIVVIYYGTELPLEVTEDTKILGGDKKDLPKDKLIEGSLIEKLEYELQGQKYIAKKIFTDISTDGSIKLEGLYEGMRGDLAVIDGYLVRLKPGVKLEGSKKKKKVTI